MSMTIGAVIASMNVAKSIAAYFGLLDTVSSNVSSLVHQSFKSARMNLELARTSNNKWQSEEYVKEARNKFVEAIAVEQDENLVSAYAGLAMCQYLLGDKANARNTIAKIGEVKLSNPQIMKAGAKGFFKMYFPFGLIGNILGVYQGANERKQNFVKYKNKVYLEMKF